MKYASECASLYGREESTVTSEAKWRHEHISRAGLHLDIVLENNFNLIYVSNPEGSTLIFSI